MVLAAALLPLLSIAIAGFGPATARRRPSRGYNIVRNLFDSSKYDNRLRPVQEYSRPVNVTIRMNLYLINEVNERSQYIELYMWMVQMWYDEMLQWNPGDYEGTDEITVPYQLVWLPDTYLYNGLEMERIKAERWRSVTLSKSEKHKQQNSHTPNDDRVFVTFRYPAIYKFVCQLDILFYPFDRQSCKMVFGSWTYDVTKIDYHPMAEDVFMESYNDHPEWTVVSFKVKRVEEHYKCCVRPYALLEAVLVLRRKPSYTISHFVLPTVIINFIAPFGFFMPTTTTFDRTEKVGLGLTTLLSMSILLLTISEKMPTTSNYIPLIGWFYIGFILLIAMCTISSSAIISVQRQALHGKRISPSCRKFFFRVIAPKVLLPIPEWLVSSRRHNRDEFHLLPKHEDMDTSFEVADHSGTKTQLISNRCKATHMTTLNGHGAAVEQLIQINRKVKNVKRCLQTKEDEERCFTEWEYLALILDRLCLILFLFLATALLATFVIIGIYIEQTND